LIKRNRKKHLIVLTGVDGSGKTTQSVLLLKHLKKQRKNVILIHYEMNFIFVKFLQFIKLFNHKQTYKGDNKEDDVNIDNKNIKNQIKKLCIFLMYATDTLLFYNIKLNVLFFKYEIIIADRYPSIDGIGFFQLHGINNLFLKKLYWKCFKKPHLIFFINVSPSIAWKRRQEHSLFRQKKHYSDLNDILSEYITLFPFINVNYINGMNNIDKIYYNITKKIDKYLLCNFTL
jgi:thymidylate kinase